MTQARPCRIVAGVKMIRFNILYVAGGIHQAIRRVHGDGHSAIEIVYKKAKGAPLAGVTPGLESVTCRLKVDLYVFDEIEDLVWGIQAGLNSADHESHVNVGNFFVLAVCLEDQENGGHPTELRGSCGSRGHECALGDESTQAVEGEALHAECSS